MKREGSGSGSISQRHGSTDPDPDPHQNVMGPIRNTRQDQKDVLLQEGQSRDFGAK